MSEGKCRLSALVIRFFSLNGGEPATAGAAASRGRRVRSILLMIDLLGSASTPLSHPHRFYPHAYDDDRIFTRRGQNVFLGGPYNSGIVDGARARGVYEHRGGHRDQSQSARVHMG